MTFPGYNSEDNLIGWVQEEYYDDIYGDLFQKEQNGYFNQWLQQNGISQQKIDKKKRKEKEKEIQERLLKEKKVLMQEAMDIIYDQKINNNKKFKVEN